MSSEELIAGFKNALDRGQSLEEAKKSFINAGYKESEINEASQHVNQSTSSLVQQQSSQSESENPSTPEALNTKIVSADQLQSAQPEGKKPKKKSISKKKIIILSAILAIVLIGLGASLYFLL